MRDPMMVPQGNPPKRELRSRMRKDVGDTPSLSVTGKSNEGSRCLRSSKAVELFGKPLGMDELGEVHGQRQSVRTAIERSKRDRDGCDSTPVTISDDFEDILRPKKRVCTQSGLRIQFPAMDAAMEIIKKEFLIEEAKLSKEATRKDHLHVEAPRGKSKEHFYVNAAGTVVLRHFADPPYNQSEPPQAEHPKQVAAEKGNAKTSHADKYFKNINRKLNMPAAGIPTDNPYRPKKLSASTLAKVEAQALLYTGEFCGDTELHGSTESDDGTDSKDETESSDETESIGDTESNGGPPSNRDPMEIDFSKIDAPTALTGDLWRDLANTPTLSFGPIPSFVMQSTKFIFEQEEAFHARPSIKIIIPDLLKGLLVDDWENITRNNQLVPLPHPHPVNQVLQDYLNYEKPQRTEGSASIDILDETIAGLKEYFDKCLGRILLYR
jgi:hypothetical protein